MPLPDWYDTDQSSTTSQAPTTAPELPDWYQDPPDESGPAKLSTRLSNGIAPDHAAKVLKLKDQTGMPSDFVSRNVDKLQTQRDNSTLTPEFSEKHPAVTGYISEDPNHAAVVGQDLKSLGFVERQFKYMTNQAKRGMMDTERSIRWALKGVGYQDPDNDKRVEDIEKRLQGDMNIPEPGTISGIFGQAVEAAPALAGAIGAGAVASLAKVPATPAIAAAFGTLEFGNAYSDFSSRKDEQGNPKMTDAEARGFAMLSGVGNGLLFTLPIGKMAKAIPGLNILGKEGLMSMIQSPTIFPVLKKFAGRIGEMGLTMGGFSGIGSLIHSASGHLGEMKSEGLKPDTSYMAILERLFPPEDLKAAGKAALSSIPTGMVMGMVPGATGAIRDYRNYTGSMKAKDLYYIQKTQNAVNNAQGWKNIGTALENTKIAEIAPEQVDNLMKRVAPSENVFIPLEQWQTYWAEQKVDPRAAFLEVAGDIKTYDEALRTGTDLQLPASKYASKIAPTEHNAYFSDHLRSEPLAMSAEDAKSSVKINAEIEKEEAKAKIQDEIVAPPIEESAIRQAQDKQGMSPLFDNPESLGMKPEHAARYKRAIEEAHADAQEEIVRKITDEQTRQKSASWLAERGKIEKDIEVEAIALPEYRAIRFLQGKLPVGELEQFKLSKQAVEAEDISGSTKGYPQEVLAERGGIHPDEAAALLGFNSGSELLYKIKTAPKFEEYVKEQTDSRMIDRHPEARSMFGSAPDLMSDAMEMVHNEKRSQVLRLELEHLASEDFAAFKGLVRAIGRRIPTIKEVRAEAEEMIGKKTTAETLPSLYLRAESVASREAQEHFLRGDFEKSFEAKKAELLNHELYRAAVEAKERSTKDVNFAMKFENDSARQRLGKAGGTYLEQIDAIREAFDFGRVTLKELGERQSLRDWVQSQKDSGYNPVVPPDLLDQAGRKSWRQMSNNELHSTVDAMRNIAHLAGLKNKLLAAVKERTFDETRKDIVDKLTKRYNLTPEKLDKPYEQHPSTIDRFKGNLNSGGAFVARKEPLFDQTGMHEAIFEPMNVAENFRSKELRKSRVELDKIFDVYSKIEKATFGRVRYISELKGSGLDPNLNKMEMMMTLFNSGNEGNMQQLMRGYKMTEAQLRGIWKHLEPRDLEVAQKVWDFIDSYWPQITKQERELNGLVPEKVEGRPLDVTLADGSKHHLEGGYFPLVYDKDVSWRTEVLKEFSDIKEMFPSNTGPTATKHTYTMARIGGGDQAPSLKFDVLTGHIFDVIHRLSYQKPVVDVYKIINDPDIRLHMQAGFGKGMYKELNPWLKNIAGTREWDPLGPLAGLSKLRSNMTTVEIGVKLAAAFNDVATVLPAMHELKGYYAKGFKAFSSPIAAFKFMFENSEMMKTRWEDAGDRDIRAAGSMFNLVNENPGKFAEIKAMAPGQIKDFYIISRLMDMAVAGPIWYGAYFKAMAGDAPGLSANNKLKSVSYAEKIVRDLKGSGAAKDLSPFQASNSSLLKLMSMFYSQLNVILNRGMKGYRDFRTDKNMGAFAGLLLMNWFLPSVVAEIASGRGPSSEKEETWFGWAGKTMVMAPFALAPGVREVASAFQRGEYKLSPVESAVETIAKTAKNIVLKNPIADKITGDESEWTKQNMADAVMALGYIKGLPTRQLVQSMLRLHGWATGEEPHNNPFSGIFSVITGSKNDRG